MKFLAYTGWLAGVLIGLSLVALFLDVQLKASPHTTPLFDLAGWVFFAGMLVGWVAAAVGSFIAIWEAWK